MAGETGEVKACCVFPAVQKQSSRDDESPAFPSHIQPRAGCFSTSREMKQNVQSPDFHGDRGCLVV